MDCRAHGLRGVTSDGSRGQAFVVYEWNPQPQGWSWPDLASVCEQEARAW